MQAKCPQTLIKKVKKNLSLGLASWFGQLKKKKDTCHGDLSSILGTHVIEKDRTHSCSQFSDLHTRHGTRNKQMYLIKPVMTQMYCFQNC